MSRKLTLFPLRSVDARLFHSAESIRRQSIKKPPTQSFKQPRNINNANLFLLSMANRIIWFISSICLAVTQLLSPKPHAYAVRFLSIHNSAERICAKCARAQRAMRTVHNTGLLLFSNSSGRCIVSNISPKLCACAVALLPC